MSNRVWTEADVRRIYGEWRELSEHALEVVAEYYRLQDRTVPDLGHLTLPDWCGTGWPGENFIVEVNVFDDDRNYAMPPLSYLWDDSWRERMRAEYDRWRQSDEAHKIEKRERDELARLKRKYESVPESVKLRE